MPESSYGETMKQHLLHERQNADAIRSMLEQSPTNSRVTARMARVCTAVDDVTSHWRGGYQNLFGNYTTTIQRYYMNVDGYARVQAIEIAQAQSVTGEALKEERKRGGVMGWITGG
jgi:hypothetical protein